MPEIIPTPEQLTIIEAVSKTTDSLLINALAGAAKTSTLVMAAHKLPITPALCVAFNKRIAEEMAKRMPGHITCQTLNSVGHRAWGAARGKRLVLNSSKVYEILKERMDRIPQKENREAFGEAFASLKRAVSLAKMAGYVPSGFTSMGKSLCDEAHLLDLISPQLDVEPDDWFLAELDRALSLNISQAFDGLIDFDDQIYMPTLFGAQFTKFPVVMVDEAQDLSPLNHTMLERMVGGRLIAVGDPNQAIYGFRGAHKSSMQVLGERFGCRELTLSTSFRCPVAVVERLRFRVPQMNYPEWAKPGKVERLEEWGSETIPDGAAIICRNNAPIFQIALELLRQRRSVKILGNDIGASLLKIMKKLGPDTMPRDSVLGAIKEWENESLAKANEARKASIRDRAECLRVFGENGATLGEAIAFADAIFSADGRILLMSGHKSKGLEYETVFHLDPFRIPSKWARLAAEEGDTSQLEQEYNLRYVIESRPMANLYLVNLEDFS